MSTDKPRSSIQELGLDDSEELKLYLELIRIIEKDIDELKASATRNGWTSWAMIGGIVGAVLLLFGETRKLQSLPTQQIEIIWLTGLLLYTFVISIIRVLYVDDQNIRPGRVRWTKDVYFSHLPSGLFTLLVFFVSIFIAWILPVPILIKILILTTLSVWTLWMALLLVMTRIELPLGNTKVLAKSGRWIQFMNFLLSLFSLLALLPQLHRPIGEDATLPYILGGLLLAMVLLAIRLIFSMAPSRLLSVLKDLRNDIIFLRSDIDQALRRYEVIAEGETLPDALQNELSEVLRDLNVIAYAQANMENLIVKMLDDLPDPSDTKQEKARKDKQVALDKDSYVLHDAKCREILNSLGAKLKTLNKKIQNVAGATGDWAGANAIRSSLGQQLELVEQGETQLKQRIQKTDYFLANPDQIPAEVRRRAESSS